MVQEDQLLTHLVAWWFGGVAGYLIGVVIERSRRNRLDADKAAARRLAEAASTASRDQNQ